MTFQSSGAFTLIRYPVPMGEIKQVSGLGIVHAMFNPTACLEFAANTPHHVRWPA